MCPKTILTEKETFTYGPVLWASTEFRKFRYRFALLAWQAWDFFRLRAQCAAAGSPDYPGSYQGIPGSLQSPDTLLSCRLGRQS